MKDTVTPTCVAEQARSSMEKMLEWKDNIEQALAHAEFSHTFDDVTLMVLKGQLTFFHFGDCYCLSQITVFPQFTTFHIMVAGGNFENMLEQVSMLETLAKAHGCRYLSISGRKGFERALKDHGWEHKFTTMWKGVDE